MTEPKASLDAGYFEALYADAPDPWSFRTSPYEREKYGATLDVLPRAALCVGSRGRLLHRRLHAATGGALRSSPGSRCLGESSRRGQRRQCRPALGDVSRGHAAERLSRGPLRPHRPLRGALLPVATRICGSLADRCLAALEPDGQMVLCHWLGETNYPSCRRRSRRPFHRGSGTAMASGRGSARD